MPRRADGPFRILTVCTGNICRSPQAAALLRARLPTALGPEVVELLVMESAGTAGLEGWPMDEHAAAEAICLGVTDTAAHRARRLRAPMVEQADLVLGLERSHRGAAVQLDPSANRRAFTLTEFAALLETLEPGEDVAIPEHGASLQAFLAEVVGVAAARRGSVAATRTIRYDIEDPYRRERAIYRRSADTITATVDVIVERLGTLAGP
ncbi:low molecular weight phosphatase family protein [Pseudactinotalea terrae]|uniref:arsenate reductase/protein-tyrosine-phosphatase family protein n=1 Tax=Pseudactinotalea terrae TaxID=1743262 RepID=UPI0012E2D49A|nr:low molecular weight phosphatase family protein [Pseudactinotalea terrae]